ncbi:restriction endonuclease subunit S [Psychroflexus montanilacus]|uniref:restriction endonuclease subunit S n=1 Tax=Psychroflexus montanilacus TaxID=2873598 RepID=UPI001CC91DF7|nr:restriction endonuclease subunit S [Psychroflexus montanilacus]MBZ9650715.1 restriction endonuclease subunit S [Psychroflexus montanilacus]
MSYKSKSDKSHYKRLGDYIELVDQRNEDLAIDVLLGLSISKEFIPSVANTIGTNMKKYKIVHKNQFACSIMQVRRDGKMPVAILKTYDKAIISQAYPVFKVKDESVLNPDYLMMWFKRKEFDREATFHAVGGVRGSLEWEDFMSFKLPVPPIEKQRQIVAEYNAVDNRIRINEQLNQKLEETAQAIYKEWFVYNHNDFNENFQLKEFGSIITGKTPSSKNPEDFGNKMPFVTPGDFNASQKFILDSNRRLSKIGFGKLQNKILPEGSILVTCIGSDMGKVAVVNMDCITNQQVNSIVVNHSYFSDYLFYTLNHISEEKIKGIAMGSSTMPMLNKSDFEKIEIKNPKDSILKKFEEELSPINKQLIKRQEENYKLSELKDLLLSKMSKVEVEKEMI